MAGAGLLGGDIRMRGGGASVTSGSISMFSGVGATQSGDVFVSTVTSTAGDSGVMNVLSGQAQLSSGLIQASSGSSLRPGSSPGTDLCSGGAPIYSGQGGGFLVEIILGGDTNEVEGHWRRDAFLLEGVSVRKPEGGPGTVEPAHGGGSLDTQRLGTETGGWTRFCVHEGGDGW